MSDRIQRPSLDEKPVTLHAPLRIGQGFNSPCWSGTSSLENLCHYLAESLRLSHFRGGAGFSLFCGAALAALHHFHPLPWQKAKRLPCPVTSYPSARTIHIVMDNLNTHRKKSLADHLGPAQADYLWSRLKMHYTPKHGSWLNQAEIELSLISRECLRTQWNFTRKKARQKFGYLKNVSMRSEAWSFAASGRPAAYTFATRW